MRQTQLVIGRTVPPDVWRRRTVRSSRWTPPPVGSPDGVPVTRWSRRARTITAGKRRCQSRCA